MKPKTKLSLKDHEILLGLIRGETISDLGARFYPKAAKAQQVSQISRALANMRKVVECSTTHQLVALEVINLMRTENIDKLVREEKEEGWARAATV